MPQYNEDELLEKIEQVRTRMIDLSKVKPLTDAEMIEVSEELDLLLNRFERLRSKKV